MLKPEFRKSLLSRRREFSPEQRLSAGMQIQEKIMALTPWQEARVVGIYLALNDEVPTDACIRQAQRQGKIVASPVLSQDRTRMDFYAWENTNELTPGLMHILQPCTKRLVLPEEITLMLVPGVGFDLKGYRLGYGGGYYDRFLSASPAYRVGMAFDLQIVPALPVTSLDCPMDLVVTETRLLP